MDDVVISKLRKNTREEIQVRIREYQGRRFVDIRIFAGARGEETVPTQRGVAVPIEKFEDFQNAIDDAMEFLEQDR